MEMFSFSDFASQGTEIEAVRRQIQERRLVHALMITGEPGTGKRSFAGLLARALLCSAPSGVPCGACESCRLAESGENPDLIMIRKGIPLSVETKKGRSTVPVDDIREMIRICSRHSFLGGCRVVIIENAEDLTVQAQNSLLKILEEPPEDTYFILTSCQPAKVLITIRSRCRPLKFVPWSREQIVRVLEASGIGHSFAVSVAAASSGSVGKARLLASDEEFWKMQEEVLKVFFCTKQRSTILKVSTEWKDRKSDAELLFSILENTIHSLLEHRLNHGSTDLLKGIPDEWIRFSEKAEIGLIASLSDRITEARKQLAFNVNFQAVFEQLLLSFIGVFDQWVR